MAAPRRRSKRAGPGRITRLMDPGVHDGIIDALELGVPIALACQGVGVAEQSYRNWLNRGYAEHEERADENYEPKELEQPYLDFYLAVQSARAKAATRNVAVIQKAAQGGTVTERSVKRYTDREGNDVEEETLKRAAPDWRAAAWYLEKSHRSEYGKDVQQLEVSGPGGALPAGSADDLAARLSEFLKVGVATLELPGTQSIEPDDDAPEDPADDEDAEILDAELVE